jgi:hypothetical protein
MKIRSVGKIGSGRKSVKAKTIKMVLPALVKGKYVVHTVYSFDELTPEAKEKAREWMRQVEAETYDFDSDEDWLRNGEGLKGEVEKAGLKLVSINSDKFYWSWDRERYFTANVTVENKKGEQFNISGSTDRSSIQVEMLDPSENLTSEQVTEKELDVKESWKGVESSVLKNLQKNYESSFEDESIDENIRINEYEFNANGSRA